MYILICLNQVDTKKKEHLTSEVLKKAKFGFRNAQTISLHQAISKVREGTNSYYVYKESQVPATTKLLCKTLLTQ